MTRDYKSSRRTTTKKRRRTSSKARPRKHKRKTTPGWVWLLCGLGIGLGTAVGAYAYVQSQTTTDPVEKSVAKKPTAAKKIQVEAKPKKVEKTAVERPHFDFYTLLPKMEVVIPDSVIEEANRALPQAEKNLAYVLQTGSFRNATDADTMKAELALLGIEANVETVVINDKDTWNRVRLGPFPDMQSLRPVRRQLKQNGVEFILLKIKI